MDYTKKSGVCRNCKVQREARLHLQIAASGAETFVWVCSCCNAKDPFSGGMFVAKDKVQQYLTPEQIEQLPVLMFDPVNRCVVCGRRTAEMHHWAPRAIFGGECEQWPKDYLCKKCHDKWHLRVTPQIVAK